jgi:hypothetical protein
MDIHNTPVTGIHHELAGCWKSVFRGLSAGRACTYAAAREHAEDVVRAALGRDDILVEHLAVGRGRAST